MKTHRNKLPAATIAVTAALTISVQAYVGMPISKLRVSGRNLVNASGQNVRLVGGWMQPTASWFNGNRWYTDPTDWTNPNNVAGMLNFLRDAATVMSDTSPKYGRSYGWYCTFVRVNTDSIGGWTAENGLVNSAQFNGWIQNFLVPYANHLRSRGLYLVLCATGPINTPNNGTRNCGRVEQQRLITFWQTVANAPGIKSVDNIHFELMNEPVEIESALGNGDWGFGQDKYFQAFRTWIQPVIDAIRNTGADNVIWVPTLEWQGSPHQHARYPFTGSNCGIAAHLYPAYGGCYDNATCHNDLWNRNYKPATDRWPMIITENFWFPEDTGLCKGSTAVYGNTIRANFDREGNVSFMIGFLGDLLHDLTQSTPANCTLSSKQGAQAAFDWWYAYNAGGGVAPVSGRTYRIIARHSGKAMDASGAGTANGTQIIQWAYHGGNNQRWIVTDRGNGQWSIIGVQSGRCVDVNNWGTANGTKVQLWDYHGGSNQKYTFTATSGGFYRITPTHATGSCLDVEGVSTADGARVHLWQWLNGNNQQWAFQAP